MMWTSFNWNGLFDGRLFLLLSVVGLAATITATTTPHHDHSAHTWDHPSSNRTHDDGHGHDHVHLGELEEAVSRSHHLIHQLDVIKGYVENQLKTVDQGEKKKMEKLRDRLSGEMTMFQNYLHDLTSSLSDQMDLYRYEDEEKFNKNEKNETMRIVKEQLENFNPSRIPVTHVENGSQGVQVFLPGFILIICHSLVFIGGFGPTVC